MNELKIGDIVQVDFGEFYHTYNIKKRIWKAVVVALKDEYLSEIRISLFDDCGWWVTYITGNFRLIKKPSQKIKDQAYIALCKFFTATKKDRQLTHELLTEERKKTASMSRPLLLLDDGLQRLNGLIKTETNHKRRETMKDILTLFNGAKGVEL